jgi:hypothetical protein
MQHRPCKSCHDAEVIQTEGRSSPDLSTSANRRQSTKREGKGEHYKCPGRVVLRQKWGEMVFLQVELLVSWLRWLCPPAPGPWTVSPRNLERWATISDAIMSKSLIFRTRRSMRTCLNPSQNFSRCSPVNSSGDPRAVRTASSVQLLVSLVDQMECRREEKLALAFI